MRTFKLLLLVSFSLFGGVTTLAQGNSYGYLLAGPGGTFSSDGGGGATLHIAGGGEGVSNKGLGIGGEIGYLFPFEEPGAGLGLFSINGSYHHVKTKGKVIPFFTGGYSGFFRDGYANGVNLGGGITYWFKPRLGLRVDVRDHVFLGGGEALNFINVRAGISFR